MTNSDGEGVPTEAKEGEELNVTITPKFGYALPETVTVKIGGMTLGGKDYTYNQETGTITIGAEKVTGDVVITASCGYGFVHVQVKANNKDITGTIDGVDVVDPTRDITLARDSSGLKSTDLPAVSQMKDKSATVGANTYSWSIPEWLTFTGWKVNEDESGNHVDDEDQYTDLTANEDGSFTYQPKDTNDDPIIIAVWESKPTFELHIKLLPGAGDVVYAEDAVYGTPGESVTSENAIVLTGKALKEEGKVISITLGAEDYVRDGYRLTGWTTASGDPTEGVITLTYKEGMDEVMNLELTAVWTKDKTEIEGSVHVPAVFKPGEGGLGADYEVDLIVPPDASLYPNITLPTLQKAGFTLGGDYTFTGWKLEQDGKTYTESIDRVTLLKYQSSGVTFTAQWEEAEATDIYYNVDPGTLTGSEAKREVLKKDADPRTVTLPTTTGGVKAKFGWNVEGFEFLGWKSSDERIDLSFEYGDTETKPFRPIENMTITALWGASENVETWTVSFAPGVGGSGTMADLQKRVDKTNPGWTIEVPACTFTAPEGMTFSHWTVDGKRVSTSTYKVEKKETVFTAVWKTIPDTVVHVYFRANGGSGSMQTAEVNIPWNVESVTYPLPSCAITAPSGQTFSGWKYGNSILSAGSVITVTHDDTSIELVAQWRPQSSVPSGPSFGGGTGSGTGSGTGTGAGTSTGNNPVITPEPSEQPSNGEVESNVQSANTGDTVTVFPTPDSKYMTGKVTVLDKDGNEVDVTWNGDGTYSFEMPEGGVTVTAEFVTPDEVYEDIEPDDWYLAGVANAANYGLMVGVSETDFGPNEVATRAQMMTILARRNDALGSWDGGNEWYKAGLEWAVREGVSDGTRPFDALTREEIITMLYRYVNSPEVSGNKIAAFADADTVDSWAVTAMEWAVETGIMQGRSLDELAPRTTATRAELATILTRVMELIEEF